MTPDARAAALVVSGAAAGDDLAAGCGLVLGDDEPQPDLLEDPDQELVHVVLDPDGGLDELGAERLGQLLAL